VMHKRAERMSDYCFATLPSDRVDGVHASQ
jgi:hypothetical protein